MENPMEAITEAAVGMIEELIPTKKLNPLPQTDRSTHQAIMTCPRKGWWGKYYPSETGGLESTTPYINIEIGSAVHLGIEWILNMHTPMSNMELTTLDEVVSSAIRESVISYDMRMQDFDWSDSRAEGRAQVEAMIALFAYHPRGLRFLLENFEILHIEPEVSVNLGGELIFNSRPDLVVKSKLDDQYYTLDFKTAAQFDERARVQSGQDFQSILQPAVAGIYFDLPIIGEIRYNLIKGRKQRKFEDGRLVGWESASYLIRPYARIGLELELAWGEYWRCEEPHMNGKRMCNGGANHKRVGDWDRVNLWEINGVRIQDWVKEVCRVIGENEFHQYYEDVMGLIVITEPITHSEATRINTLEQVVEKDKQMRLGREAWEKSNPMGKQYVLNKFFPQDRSSCEYPYRCNFWEVCHGQVEPMEGMLMDGRVPSKFRARVANHDESEGED